MKHVLTGLAFGLFGLFLSMGVDGGACAHCVMFAFTAVAFGLASLLYSSIITRSGAPNSPGTIPPGCESNRSQ